MAAISAIIAGAGLALAAGSAYMGYENSQKASANQAAAAQKQAEIAGIQAENVGVQRQQLDLTSNQQKLQIDTQKAVIQDQAKADEIRMQAATLDATRRRRQSIREGIVAQATGLTRATNQGASQPGSSAVSQSRGSISAQTGQNVLGITQNLDVSKRLFGINKDITAQYLGAQDYNSAFVDKSKALQGQTLNNQEQIYKLGGDANLLTASAAVAGGNAATFSGLSSLGLGVANSYDKLNRVTNYFSGQTAAQKYDDAFSNTSQPTDL